MNTFASQFFGYLLKQINKNRLIDKYFKIRNLQVNKLIKIQICVRSDL